MLLRPFCFQAAFRFGKTKYTYLLPCDEDLLKTVRAHAPEAPKVFSFRPHSSSMEAARSKIHKTPKSPGLEVSKMVRHASLGQKMRELWHFKVFAQICTKMRSSTNPQFLRQPATSDPTYGVSPSPPGPKEEIGSTFGETSKSCGSR